MTDFSQLGLPAPILDAVRSAGFTAPTPIQTQLIPPMIEGRDLIGIAQTGTGKTAAFVLPILAMLAERQEAPRPRNSHVLILAPTRELAAQIADTIDTLGRNTRPGCCVVVGGVSANPQLRALPQGVDIVVATPGRLLDHVMTGAFNLNRTGCVVLDEADQMFDMGFMPTIRKLMAKLPQRRQTVLLSATMPQPIKELASDYQRDPVEVSVAPAAKPIELIEQLVIPIKGPERKQVLACLIRNPEVKRAIVFTRTKHGADRVVRHLMASGIPAAAIHGNKSQNNRQRTLDAFRGGNLSVLVATDIAARGIDIDDISHVFNYELPNVAETYVHRIGRTARAGRTGQAVSLCDGSEKKYLRDIEKLTRLSIPVGSYDPAELEALETVQETLRTMDKHSEPVEANERDERRDNRRGEPRRERSGEQRGARRNKPRGEHRGEYRGSAPRGERRDEPRGERREEYRGENRSNRRGPQREARREDQRQENRAGHDGNTPPNPRRQRSADWKKSAGRPGGTGKPGKSNGQPQRHNDSPSQGAQHRNKRNDRPHRAREA